ISTRWTNGCRVLTACSPLAGRGFSPMTTLITLSPWPMRPPIASNRTVHSTAPCGPGTDGTSKVMSSKIEAWPFSRALRPGRAMLAGGGTKFFRDLSVLVGGQIAVKLLGFVAFAYLARRLGTEAYGSVEFIVGLAGLVWLM